MNQNFGKTALMAGACAILGLAYSPSVYADAAVNTVQSVQQSKKVTGTVTDAMGPVIGASILEKGTSNGTVTDIDGNFSLNVQPGATLVISYIGFETQEIAVGNQSTINVTMKEDDTTLECFRAEDMEALFKVNPMKVDMILGHLSNRLRRLSLDYVKACAKAAEDA